MNLPKLYTGDVVACWGADTVSRVISLFTSSIVPPWLMPWAPSHVAIIHRDGAGPLWFESTTMVDGQAGAQFHSPEERWQAYQGRCVILRPTIVLDGEQRDRMGIELRKMVSEGVPYDMGGAILSGTRLLRYLAPASGKRLFCSEMVARVRFPSGRLCRCRSCPPHAMGRPAACRRPREVRRSASTGNRGK